MPASFRQGKPWRPAVDTLWQLTTEGKGLPETALARAKKQQALLQLLLSSGRQSRTALNAR